MELRAEATETLRVAPKTSEVKCSQSTLISVVLSRITSMRSR
jgi:hypothetical protein